MVLEEASAIIGGPQGAGVETSIAILARALARVGYGVLADREYYSNITGRHSYIHLKVSATRLPRSLSYPVDLLVAMDAETVLTHFTDLTKGGVAIYDKGSLGKHLEEIPSVEDATKARVRRACEERGVECSVGGVLKYLEREVGVKLVEVDFGRVLKSLAETFKLDPRQLSRYASGVVISSVAVVLDIREGALSYALGAYFKGREGLVQQNMRIYRLVSSELGSYRGLLKLGKPSIGLDKVLLATGNDVVAMAKVVAGVRYQSYYPITPAADESLLLEKYSYVEDEEGPIGPLVVMQTEDEIAAIASAIGASLAGARSSTSTSGPGFDLMVEGISFAGANEVPVVITYYQRGGPSTGQPTRGSQSDLMNAIFAAHGEFARVVLASGDHLEAFYDTVLAFNIAERFQVPVIHLLDKFLANSLATTPIPDIDTVSIDRGEVFRGSGSYRRFDLSKVVSPRAYLGAEGVVMWYTGDEHDEYGHICEDPEVRVAMYSKRVEKLKLVEESIPRERKVGVYGDGAPDYVIVGWGFTKGVAIDAIEVLEKRGLRGRYLNLRLLWPFPAREVAEEISKVPRERVVVVEHSYGANVSSLIAMTTGLAVGSSIVKFTGRPITLGELVEALERVIVGGERRVVLSYGA